MRCARFAAAAALAALIGVLGSSLSGGGPGSANDAVIGVGVK